MYLHDLGGKAILFYQLKQATILDLLVKYGLHYLKDPRNEFLQNKSFRRHTLQNHLANIKHLLYY